MRLRTVRRILGRIGCMLGRHKPLHLTSFINRSSALVFQDASGRSLVGVHLCRYCHNLYWENGDDVAHNSADFVENFEIENVIRAIRLENMGDNRNGGDTHRS